MDRSRQWLMTKQQIQKFDQQRQKQYKHICEQQKVATFQDRKLITYYLSNLVDFLHRRKRNIQCPFQFQKTIYLAVSFYKKYRLLRSFIDEEPSQSMICAVYLALKISEFNDVNIKEYSQSWRNKPVFEPTKNNFHYGDQGYSLKQLNFLTVIGFQTGVSPLINSLEALYMRFIRKSSKMQQQSVIGELLTAVFILLRNVYIDYQLTFLIDGPKIALAIFIIVLRDLKLEISLLGEDIKELYEQNMKEIEQVVQKVKSIENHNNQKFVQENNIVQMRGMTKAKFKKPEIRRTSTFLPKNQSLTFDKAE